MARALTCVANRNLIPRYDHCPYPGVSTSSRASPTLKNFSKRVEPLFRRLLPRVGLCSRLPMIADLPTFGLPIKHTYGKEWNPYGSALSMSRFFSSTLPRENTSWLKFIIASSRYDIEGNEWHHLTEWQLVFDDMVLQYKTAMTLLLLINI